MDKVSLILVSIMSLALVVFMAPNVMAMNRGRALRNIALWLAIFVGVGLLYRIAGPGRMAQIAPVQGVNSVQQDRQDDASNDDAVDEGSDLDRNAGYTPPKE